MNLLKEILQLPNKQTFLILLFIIPAFGCQPGGDNNFTLRKPSPVIPLAVLDSIREGDVLLRQGRGAFSEKIIEFMNEQVPFSHCGLAIKHKGKIKIIHSVSEELSGRDGVQLQGLKEFSSDVADSIFCIVRPNISPEQIEQIKNIALNYLNNHTPFDYEYNTNDSSQLYCSEFLYYTVGSVMGKEVFMKKDCGNVQLVLFNSFLNPKYFTTIYCLKQY
jgi:hypothetical protein